MTNDLSFLNKEKLHTGFGEEIKNPSSYNDVLDQAGLNWTVSANPVFTEFMGKMIEVPNSKIIVRDADEKPLGIVSDKYKIVNNSDAFAFTESIYNSKDIEFIRGGSYRGGSSTWLEAKITGEFSVLGDETECYLLFLNSHDGTGSVRCMIVPNRIACSNALNFPLKSANRHWRCVHSGDPMKKIDEARKILLAGSSYMNALDRECEVLQSIKMSDIQVGQLINRLFPIDEANDTEVHKKHQTEKRLQLLDVFTQKDDLASFGNTGYKFISAVADYVDHAEFRKSSNMNRYMYIANGSPLVDKAYDMVLSL